LKEKLRPIFDIHIKYKFAVLGVDDILEKNCINDWIKPSRKIYVKFLLDF
jgi:hypothetical protein